MIDNKVITKITLGDEYRETTALQVPSDFLPTKLNIYKGREGEETLVGVYKLQLFEKYPDNKGE